MLFTSSERHSDPKRFGAERQKLFLSVQSLELIEPVVLVDSASSTICIHFFLSFVRAHEHMQAEEICFAKVWL